MLELFAEKLCRVLRAAGIPACAAYPDGPAAPDEAVYLSLSRAETPEGGSPRYLGLRQTDGQGEQEVYGLHCKVTLELEACVPLEAEDGARAAMALLHRAVGALSAAPLHLEQLRRETPSMDRAAGLLRLRGTAEGSVWLLLEDDAGDEAAFDEFVLRGELKV